MTLPPDDELRAMQQSGLYSDGLTTDECDDLLIAYLDQHAIILSQTATVKRLTRTLEWVRENPKAHPNNIAVVVADALRGVE